MIDTVRFKIPLLNTGNNDDSDDKRSRLLQKLIPNQYYDKNGELRQRFFGKIPIPPFDSCLNMFISGEQTRFLYLEGSLPKLWYGDNVNLLYPNQFEPLLEIIFVVLNKEFQGIPHYSIWEIQRMDACYAWKFESDEKSIEIIKYAQTLEFPRKNKRCYTNESVDFDGGWYKVKFYRKEPEFRKNGDSTRLVDKGYAYNVMDTLDLSCGVVRFEITNRRKELLHYFKKPSIRYDSFLTDDFFVNSMNTTLSKFEANIDKGFQKDEKIIQVLSSKYKANKALRLFCFYIAFCVAKLTNKKIIRKYANSGDISNNLKALDEVMIEIPKMLDVAPFKFPIPSPLVVNPPLDEAAIAAQSRGVLEIINKVQESVEEVLLPL